MISDQLMDFALALLGLDVEGDGSCEICGRDLLQTWEVSSADGRAELCGPCLREELDHRERAMEGE